MPGFGNSTLVINAGSSSVKFRLYSSDNIILDGVIDRIAKDTVVEYSHGNKRHERKIMLKTYSDAARIILGVIKDHSLPLPKKIVHRIVHGSMHFHPQNLTQSLLSELRALIPLAPLHIPHALELISYFKKETNAQQMACFDTSFHRTIPKIAETYAIPANLANKHKIIRYGFHGIAHQFLYEKAASLAKKRFKRVITLQLGNGASVCAIKDGKSIDTSMGFTPLEGVVMGTRSGSIDPAIVSFLLKNENLSIDKIDNILMKESGLKALAKESDVRNLLMREKKGDKKAKFALDLFAYSVKKQLGAYIAALGGVDLIALGGGVPRAPLMRKRILSGLEDLGIVINNLAINECSPCKISKGKVAVYVIETDEQEQMYKLTKNL